MSWAAILIMITVFAAKPSPYDSRVFEAIATAFAVDVPSLGLLVLSPTSPVTRAVYDLRRMGVNAVALDVTDQTRGGAYLAGGEEVKLDFKLNPVLLVCTRATARGIDLPELTHVFIIDMFEGYMKGQLVDEYLHIAGRVGRFGRGGKVITFINDNKGLESGSLPSERILPRVLRVFHEIGAQPVIFEPFDMVKVEVCLNFCYDV